jgi:hypothetical protein
VSTNVELNFFDEVEQIDQRTTDVIEKIKDLNICFIMGLPVEILLDVKLSFILSYVY